MPSSRLFVLSPSFLCLLPLLLSRIEGKRCGSPYNPFLPWGGGENTKYACWHLLGDLGCQIKALAVILVRRRITREAPSESVVLVTALYLENTEAAIAQKGLEAEQKLIKEGFLLPTTQAVAAQWHGETPSCGLPPLLQCIWALLLRQGCEHDNNKTGSSTPNMFTMNNSILDNQIANPLKGFWL